MDSSGKHSSSDLLSRLKTRKILGVGETDNGDIHRSKISQVLGHNEHLYVKLPKGYWLWHLSMAAYLTSTGVLGFLFPSSGHYVSLRDRLTSTSDMMFSSRLHGASVTSLSVMLWSTLGTNDKATAKTSLVGVIVYNVLHICAEVTYMVGTKEVTSSGVFSVLSRLLMTAGSTCFYHLISTPGGIPGSWTKKINCLKDKDTIQEDFAKSD